MMRYVAAVGYTEIGSGLLDSSGVSYKPTFAEIDTR